VNSFTEILNHLFYLWTRNYPEDIIPLPPSGSPRKYFRLKAGDKSAIGAWNPVVEENEAFLYFSGHFRKHGLHVPVVYAIDAGKEAYLIEDIGDTSLFSLADKRDPAGEFPLELIAHYKASLKELVRFQVVAGKDLDFRYCYPHSAFDARSMRWDLNYFKYYFLKLHVDFHEGKLENDFDSLVDFLSQADANYFMYRDFQSRNILIKDNKPYFIDYQGGRRGPLQYDVASLLFQVKADLPFNLRELLLDEYIAALSEVIDVDEKRFKKYYYGFVLMRLLQVLGAYGYRGIIEKKPHFLASIPFALKNLEWWLENFEPGVEMPELLNSLRSLTTLKKYMVPEPGKEPGKLTVTIKSFSYRQGIPADQSINGGGFVFDCRALPNPGREERYRAFNGKDKIIIDYLEDKPEVIEFLNKTEHLVSQSVDNYLSRRFTSLSVNFGCTGGQHRSVYCAETLAGRLRERYREVEVILEHTNL
jgi:aminoglycoside/choline kinase family phosphotransferase